MDKHRVCKICNKRFPNGKAMGGHMRSHLAKLPIPPKPNNPSLVLNNPVESTSKYPSSSSSLSIYSNKDRMQTFRSVNGDFSDLGGESEAESSRNLTKRRSKRRRKMIGTVFAPPPALQAEPESVSSITEFFFSDEEVAMCLLMLSKSKWPEKDKQVSKEVNEYIDDDDGGGCENIEEDEDENEDDSFLANSRPNAPNKYECKTCKKCFSSYQALGGHKASHKKMIHHGKRVLEEGSRTIAGNVVVLGPRIFKCPFCDKVFDSGQALGGHKKIHFSYLAMPKDSAKSGEIFIDLNLPAPEAEDDSEVSQV